MSLVEFIYNKKKTEILCNGNEKLEEIIKRFCLKLELNIENMNFLYEGKNVDMNSTFINTANSEDKNKKKISIIVYDKASIKVEQYLQKSKYIICPECKENIRIKIKDFKIELYDCPNCHDIKNLSLSEFEKSQMINKLKINNDKSKKTNNNKTINTQNKNSICETSDDNIHNTLDYEEKYFKCILHKESYTMYCKQCKKNICIICEKEHINHNKISLGEILLDKNKLEENKNKLRKILDEFENDIKIIIDKLNNVLKNMEKYYNIFDDLMGGYEIKKINFHLLKNLNNIYEYNNIIIKDLNQIIIEKDINFKFKSLMNIWDKINLKEIKETNKIINSINNNENKNEIKNEVECETKDWYEKTPCEDDINDFTIIEKSKKNKVNDNTISKDDSCNNFNINNMKKISQFYLNNSTMKINKLIILKDERILIYTNWPSNTLFIYRLEEEDYNDICEVQVVKKIIDIIQLEDENLLTFEDKLKIYRLEEKEIELIKEKKINLYNARLYCLMNNKNKIIVYNREDSNVYIYSYKDNDLIFDKSINTEKKGVTDVCEINNKEIAINYCTYSIFGKSNYILFYDLEKNQIIKMINVGGQLCYLNEENLVAVNNKIYLIDLINHIIKSKIKCKDSNYNCAQVFRLNNRGFIVFWDSIQYYEIQNNSNIILKGRKSLNARCIQIFKKNKILVAYNDTIYIYE